MNLMNEYHLMRRVFRLHVTFSGIQSTTQLRLMLTAARWVTMMSLDSQGVEMKTFHTISSVLCVVAPLKHLDSSLEYFEEEVRTKWRAGAE